MLETIGNRATTKYLAGLIALPFWLGMVNRTVAADMDYPLAVAADEKVVYVADRYLPGIWKISEGKRELYFKGDKKFRTPLNAIRCLTLDAKGRLLAGDSSTREVYRFNAENKPEPLSKGGIGIPMGIACNKQGEIFVADLETHRIMKIAEAGGEPTLFAEVPSPRGIAIDAEDRLWVISHGKDQLLRIAADGKIEPIVKGRPFQFPHTLVLDKKQNAYVVDGYAKAVWKATATGNATKWVEGKPLINPVGLAWQGETLLIADPHAKALFQADKDAKLTAFP